MNESRPMRGGSKAVIYARTATEPGLNEEPLILAQVLEARAFAARAGLSVVAEYVDRASSGLHEAPPAFCRMLENVQQPGSDIGFVVVTEFTRISRSFARARARGEVLAQHGVELYFAHQNRTFSECKPEFAILDEYGTGHRT